MTHHIVCDFFPCSFSCLFLHWIDSTASCFFLFFPSTICCPHQLASGPPFLHSSSSASFFLFSFCVSFPTYPTTSNHTPSIHLAFLSYQFFINALFCLHDLIRLSHASLCCLFCDLNFSFFPSLKWGFWWHLWAILLHFENGKWSIVLLSHSDWSLDHPWHLSANGRCPLQSISTLVSWAH